MILGEDIVVRVGVARPVSHMPARGGGSAP